MNTENLSNEIETPILRIGAVMPSCLQLSLITNWFDMTKALIKKEDYRELTPFWCNRFLLYDGKPKTVKWWSFMQNYEGCFFRKAIESSIENGKITFKHFDINRMTLGYPKATDLAKIINLQHKGIEIRTGNPKWGAVPNKIYFVIMHGDVLA
jgi:hypothetical protein